MSVEEIQEVHDEFQALCQIHRVHLNDHVEPRLMIGILASSKTMQGIPNKYPGRYPAPAHLGELSRAANLPNALCLVHYSTDNVTQLVRELINILRIAPTIDGFQLNVRWPQPRFIERLRGWFPNCYVILQIGREALEEIRWNPSHLCQKLGGYVDTVDEVLLDASGGTGEPINVPQILPLVNALSQLSFGVGVAGGLSAESISRIKPVTAYCQHLSIDAEGRLRNPGDDSLSMEKVRAYLAAAFQLFYPINVHS